MKIINAFGFLICLPTIAFAVSENIPFNALYILPSIDSKNHFDLKKSYDTNDDIFNKKISHPEPHFSFLNFNKITTKPTVTFQFLPFYDFSKNGVIEEYQNNLHICPHCFTLFQIKF